MYIESFAHISYTIQGYSSQNKGMSSDTLGYKGLLCVVCRITNVVIQPFMLLTKAANIMHQECEYEPVEGRTKYLSAPRSTTVEFYFQTYACCRYIYNLFVRPLETGFFVGSECKGKLFSSVMY